MYLQQNAAIASIFQQWIEPLKDLGVSTITMRDTGGTDHEAFDSVGIPGFQFIQDMLDYGSRTHHSNMDTYERLQPEDLAQAATGGGDFRLQHGACATRCCRASLCRIRNRTSSGALH